MEYQTIWRGWRVTVKTRRNHLAVKASQGAEVYQCNVESRPRLGQKGNMDRAARLAVDQAEERRAIQAAMV